MHQRGEGEQASVSTLELFFDLVFVFALTQVTAFMAEDISARSVIQGVLIVVLLWWAWTGYAWLANVVSAEETPIKVVMLAAMAAMFLLALCIPEAYEDGPGGLDGPIEAVAAARASALESAKRQGIGRWKRFWVRRSACLSR